MSEKVAVCVVLLCLSASAADTDEVRRVREATRFDAAFAASEVPALAGSYHPRHRRYRFIAADSVKGKSVGLVVFLPPGDETGDIDILRTACAEAGLALAVPVGVGEGRPVAERVRATLDVVDDVRRSMNIDADRTYLAGEGVGGELAAMIATRLSEAFAGVAAIRATPLPPESAYLRIRAAARLRVALVGDGRTKEVAAPAWKAVGVDARLWATADEKALGDVLAWLEADAPRRRKDRAAAGRMADPTPSRKDVLREALDRTADAAPRHAAASAAMLEWAVARAGATAGVDEATRRLDKLRGDLETRRVIDADRRKQDAALWTAVAAGEEATGRLGQALAMYSRAMGASDDADALRGHVARLTAAVKATPSLGLTLAGGTNVVRGVTPGSPADSAGLRIGDVVESVDRAAVSDAAGVRDKLRGAGPEVTLGVRRGGKTEAFVFRR